MRKNKCKRSQKILEQIIAVGFNLGGVTDLRKLKRINN